MQAYLIQTEHGNVLFDCIGLLHPDCVTELAQHGGIAAIAVSHPHFYTACDEWAEAFNCKVLIHAADKEWVTSPSPRLEFWEGEQRQLWPGLTLLRLGGHFPGSTVLLWEAARDGRGVVFAGDTVFPVPSGGVSFMYSFPNLIPLPGGQVARIGAALQRGCPRGFDRLYGPFPQSVVRADAAAVVQRSVDKYCGILDGTVKKAFL